MKSALIVFLFPLLSTGVFGDVETVLVKEGDSVTLHSQHTEIQKTNFIEWKFGETSIAHIEIGSSRILEWVKSDGPFKDRLQLDTQTGDLKIKNISSQDSGDFSLQISSKSGSTSKSFNVRVVPVDPVKTVSVMVGDSVTLNTDVPEPQKYDVMQWRFKNSPIAEINRKTRNSFTSNTDEGFKDRLQLDYWTGSLTIRNITTTHSGDYEYDISISSHTIHRSFTVTVSGEMKSALSVKEGESVTLNSDLTEIQTDNLMQWMFGDTVLAEIYKADDRFSPSDGRLKLDHQTGSLTITDTTFTDSGLYELKISNSRCTVLKRITVTVTDPGLSPGAIAAIFLGVVLLVCVVAAGVFYHRHKISELILETWIYKRTMLSVMEGESIILTPDEVHKDDKLVWMFGGCCIAERERAADSFTVHDDVLDGIFKDRLKLDDLTGSLTITNTRPTNTGQYELLIIRSGKISIKRFNVSVFAQTNEIETKSVKKGESVTLETGVTEIQEDDEIQWKFGLNIRLAEITRGDKIISPIAAKILKVKPELDHQTGSLTIKKFRPTDAGIYMLRKIEGGNIKTILFRVKVSDPTDNRNNPEEMPLTTVFSDSRL